MLAWAPAIRRTFARELLTCHPIGLRLARAISSISFHSRFATSALNLRGQSVLAIVQVPGLVPCLVSAVIHLPNPPCHILRYLELALDLLSSSMIPEPDQFKHGLIDAQSRKSVR